MLHLDLNAEKYDSPERLVNFLKMCIRDRPQVELSGLRLAVGGSGVELLGADPEPFAFQMCIRDRNVGFGLSKTTID